MRNKLFHFKGVLESNPFESKRQRHKRIQREFKKDYQEYQLNKERKKFQKETLQSQKEGSILDQVKQMLGL